MAYRYLNENPSGNQTEDCVIRGLSTFLNRSWDDIYIDLSMEGFFLKDSMCANRVWIQYLYKIGYKRHNIPDRCPNCYTVKDFAYDHPVGTYLLGTGKHVLTVIEGDYYDTWDSGNEVPIYYWRKEQ